MKKGKKGRRGIACQHPVRPACLTSNLKKNVAGHLEVKGWSLPFWEAGVGVLIPHTSNRL